MRNFTYYTTFLVSIIFFLFSCEYEEPEVGAPAEQYQKFIGGAFNETLTKSIVLEDGSLLILASKANGTTNVGDYYLAKTDNFGNLIWEQQYGGNFDDRPQDMILLEDGSLMILGFMTALNGDKDFVLLKTDSEGELIDSLSFGQPDRIEEGNKIIQLESGNGFVIGGTIKINNQVDDNLFYKINNNGEVVWSLNYGNLIAPGDVIGMTELANEQVLWVGNSNLQSSSDSDILISVINNLGLSQVINYYGENNQTNEIANSLIQYGSQWLVAGSITNSDQNTNNALVVDFSFSSDIIINQTLVNETEENLELNDLALAPDGRLMVTGKIESSPDNFDIYLSKWDLTGNIIWEKTYGGAANDEATTITVENNQITLTGSATVATNQSLTILRTDLDGELTE